MHTTATADGGRRAGERATFGRPFEVRFTDGEGWGRIMRSKRMPALMRVWAWCATEMDYRSQMRPVPQAVLAHELGLSQSQVSRALALLTEVGVLERERVGRQWLYRLDMTMGWRGSAADYQTAKRDRAQANDELEAARIAAGAPPRKGGGGGLEWARELLDAGPKPHKEGAPRRSQAALVAPAEKAGKPRVRLASRKPWGAPF